MVIFFNIIIIYIIYIVKYFKSSYKKTIITKKYIDDIDNINHLFQ